MFCNSIKFIISLFWAVLRDIEESYSAIAYPVCFCASQLNGSYPYWTFLALVTHISSTICSCTWTNTISLFNVQVWSAVHKPAFVILYNSIWMTPFLWIPLFCSVVLAKLRLNSFVMSSSSTLKNWCVVFRTFRLSKGYEKMHFCVQINSQIALHWIGLPWYNFTVIGQFVNTFLQIVYLFNCSCW